jgi:hypothetical protein
MEGMRKVQEAAERRAHGNCPVPEPSSTYHQLVSLWEIVEVQSMVGGLYSGPASGLWWNVGSNEPAAGQALSHEHEKLLKAYEGQDRRSGRT